MDSIKFFLVFLSDLSVSVVFLIAVRFFTTQALRARRVTKDSINFFSVFLSDLSVSEVFHYRVRFFTTQALRARRFT
jgi:hypothetical protein